MTFHALAVDDTIEILEDVKDRLECLDHTCDCVTCVHLAREQLGTNSYSYILLDLEIPVRYGRPSRISNGQNLLNEIRAMKGYEDIPIIVMTSHGHDSPDLAVDVLRGNGAIDFVKKPFPDNGHTLENSILCALDASGRSRPGAKTRSTAKSDVKPTPFEEGDLIFYDTHVELCGVKLCGDVESGIIRRILDELKQKLPSGKRAFFSGEQLAKKLGEGRDQNTVAGAVRNFRNQAAKLLLNEVKIQIDHQEDLILNDRRYGYRLSPKLRVVECDASQADPIGSEHDPVKTIDAPINDAEFTPEKRREWIMAQLRQNRRIQRKHLTAEFSCSPSTAGRDLNFLRDAGLIEFKGSPKTGYWKNVK